MAAWTRFLIVAAGAWLLSIAPATAGPPEGKGGKPSDKGGKPSDKGAGGKPSGAGGRGAGMEIKDSKTGGSVRILGQSGKMVFGMPGDKEDEKVTIKMSSIKEVDVNGNTVGQAGPNDGKHSRNTFANTNFAFSEPYDTDVSGVAARAIDFDVKLINDVADLSITAIIFTENGTITPTPSDEHVVSPGALKFNVELLNWPFCDGEDSLPCQGAVGAFVDIGIEVTSKGGQELQAATSANKTVSLGEGVEMVLSDAVQLDGEWTTLPEGYPTLDITGGTHYEMTLRIPKFSKSALYDPIVKEEANPGLSTLAWVGIIGGAVVVLCICMAAVAFLLTRSKPSGQMR